MKKTLHDLQDIENFFLQQEVKEDKKTLGKSPRILENKVEVLEKEIKDLKKQISILESGLDKKSSNKGGNLKTKDTEDIARMFMDFSVDDFQNKEVNKEMTLLKDENDRLKKENKNLQKHMKIVEVQKKEKAYKNISYNDIIENIKRKYGFLAENSKISLASAEYLFLNETLSAIDYTGSYINYVKALEIELRRVFGRSNEKLTFGNLMEQLKNNPTFKSFVERIDNERVGEVRNNAVHNKAVSKNECGKIRKLLMEDGWMDRISFLVEENLKEKKDTLIDYDTFIINKIGKQFIKGKNYNHYHTDGEMDILSLNPNLKDFVKGKGKILKIGAQYFIVID